MFLNKNLQGIYLQNNFSDTADLKIHETPVTKAIPQRYKLKFLLCYNRTMEKVTLTELYKQFFMLGVQLLGGGYVIVPLMKKAFIEDRNWLTEDELVNFYALGQCIPGIIAANVSAFTGYKLRGKRGAAVALAGIITSPIICILTIAAVLDKLLQLSFIQSVFWAVNIAVVILLYLSVKEVWGKSMKDLFSWVIFIATIIASLIFKVSPAIIIVCSLVFGVIYKVIEKKRSER